MSYVTGVVLFLPVLGVRQSKRALEEVNAAFNCSGFKSISDHAGGSKHPEIEIWGAGFNYLDEKSTLAHLKSVDWKNLDIDWVQMCFSRQESWGVKMQTIFSNDQFEPPLNDFGEGVDPS